MADDERSPLHLDPDEMRRMGYRTVDMLVERLTGDAGPVVRHASFEDLRERLSSPPPEAPLPFDEALAALERDVLPFVARLGHPGYLAFIPGEGTWAGALGDLIASALNVDTCWWIGAPGPTALELVVIDWFKDWVGYPAEASGLLTSGGSASNMTALACARESLVGTMDGSAVAYMSDQTHSSMARAARVLGFRPDQVRVIPTDHEMRIRVDGLRGAIAHDLAAGRRPLAVIANAGATGAGAVDPFAELAEVCREHDAWLHVDGAYGGFAVLTERGKAALAGIELADSITLDPHKWLYQPVEAGALLVRNGELLRYAFEITPDYLKDVEVGREVNFSDLGIQLTRSCRAIKLWLSLQTFGVRAFRQAIDRCLDLAAAAQERIERSPSLELLTPASLGIVTFRRRPEGINDEPTLDRLNAALAEQVEQGGEVFVSTGRVRGRLAIRLCILNHSTTMAEVERAIELVETLDVETAEPPPPRRREGSDIKAGWLGRPQLDAEGLRSLPLFSTLDDVAAQRVLRRAREHVALGNDSIVEQWSASRDLYVILSGGVNIVADGRAVASLGPGEFFGEIAAIDWGASYGRPRVASVIAIRRSRLLVLDPDLVQWLMSADPAVSDRIERTARERLAAR
jgi:aromatic-L-amino-acid/L-tryptophan decarboxylase